ncbi:MAG: hypothetical protein ACRYFV_14275 [Janthinobacterium lividum]
MKNATLLVAAFALLSVTGCQSIGDEVQPRNYDALALETGHWEWDASTLGWAGRRTPTSMGFTRQLVFSADGKVLIQHDGKLNKRTSYQLSMGDLQKCSIKQVPIITFETDSDVPNNDRKTYSITKSIEGQQLTLVGEEACVDGGTYETYHWVAE